MSSAQWPGRDAALVKKAFPHVAGAAAHAADLLTIATRHKLPTYCEFEARLGRVVTDAGGKPHFVSGIDQTTAALLLKRLASSKGWTASQPWRQLVDRFYLLPSGLEVRSTTEVPSTDDEDVVPAVTHVIKSSVKHVDLRWAADATAAPGAAAHAVPEFQHILKGEHGQPFDVRLSVKHEEPLYEDELAQSVQEMNVVRIKQRKTWHYTPAGKGSPTWSIDVTLVWQHDSFSEAQEALRTGVAPKYEVEVECRRPVEQITRDKVDAHALGLSMLLKTADLFEVPQAPRLGSSKYRLVPVR